MNQTIKSTLAAALLAATMLSCKKNKTQEPQLTINPAETATAETGKVVQYNFAGSLTDASGNNLSATSNNTVTFSTDRFSRPGQAALFDGINSAAIFPSLFSQQINYPFAVSLWFKANQVDSLQTLFLADGMPGYTNYTGFSLQIGGLGRSGSLAFSTGNNSCACPSARQTSYLTDMINPDTWYHVVVNVLEDGFDGRDIYLNGVKQSNPVPEGVSSIPALFWLDPDQHSTAAGTLGINYNPQYNYQKFGGLLDDIRIYKKLLTAGDVAALYNWQP